jgi:uncharacterized DUF497 family protein
VSTPGLTKAAINARDHDVTFVTARLAYEDPNWIEFDNPDPDEPRYNRIYMHHGRIYVVTYTERDDRIRIVSARRATRYEQRLYHDR